MNTNTPQPPSAEAIWLSEIHGKEIEREEIYSAMHTHTREWLKYFAERVKDEFPKQWPAHRASVDILLSEVTKQMEEGK